MGEKKGEQGHREDGRMETLTFNSIRSCYRKGDPFQGLRVGSRLTLQNKLSKETHMLTKQQTLSGKSAQVAGRKVKAPPEDYSASWLTVSHYMVIG